MEGIKEIMAPMIGGDENNSYSQNSSFQKGVIDAAKSLVFQAIGNNIHRNTTTTFRIADLGCSTGPNTFVAVQNIIDAVKCKHKSSGKPPPEFQVFFNDHANNDFNFLFRSLVPKSLEYYVAGVPGSFYKSLFPKASIDCVHCSYALHWLSKVPEQVRDERSSAWNRGKVFFTGVETEVVEAYSGQFRRDMSKFLKERAEELVDGGLVVIQVPGVPDDEPLITRTTHGLIVNLFGASFTDMVQQGFITEEEMDSFNFPNYFPSIKELKMLIEMNSSFEIEHIGALKHPMEHLPFDVDKTTTGMRSVMEGLIGGHFGNRIIDKLFQIFSHKLAENIDTFDNGVRRGNNLSVILRRKVRCDVDNLVFE